MVVFMIPIEIVSTWVVVTGRFSFPVYLIVDVLHQLTSVFDPFLIVLGDTELTYTKS